MKLAQGIFWIKDMEDMENNRKLCFFIYSDPDGTVLGSEQELNAKSGSTYNHKLVWDGIPRGLTGGVEYDHYPRGRVQIRNGTATVYLNPHINTAAVQDFIEEEFALYPVNGIKKVVFNSDGSAHYKCRLDE